MEPEAPVVTTTSVKGVELKFTPWDRIDIKDPNITLEGLIQYLDENYQVTLSMLSSGVVMLYSDFMAKKKSSGTHENDY